MWSTIFNGIGDACLRMFELLPSLGMAVDLVFIFLIAFGAVYWTAYGERVRKGKSNFMGEITKVD